MARRAWDALVPYFAKDQLPECRLLRARSIRRGHDIARSLNRAEPRELRGCIASLGKCPRLAFRRGGKRPPPGRARLDQKTIATTRPRERGNLEILCSRRRELEIPSRGH